MTFPFESLPENLAAFCALLRREHRFRVGPRELQDAARALELAELGDERAVRDTLRPVLTSSLEDVRVFDAAFDRFFHRIERGAPPRDALAAAVDDRPRSPEGSPVVRDAEPLSAAARPRGTDEGSDEAGKGEGAGGPVQRISDETDERRVWMLRTSYSPIEAEGAAPDLEPAGRAWREAASALVSRVRRGRSRRWIPARRGPRFDVRRALRVSLATAGDVVMPRWRARPRRRPRFVLLIDGSRSMSAHAAPALATAVALSAVSRSVETFTFSTALRRVTPDVRRAAAGERRRLRLHHAWGGGTTIGACLREFLEEFGERLLTRDTLVIVVSDGLDVGRPDVLRDAMARLSRRAAGVVWINPLLETPGYQPTAAGMRAARPFVTKLAAVPDAAGLLRLARSLTL